MNNYVAIEYISDVGIQIALSYSCKISSDQKLIVMLSSIV